jgi:hypothetical protein
MKPSLYSTTLAVLVGLLMACKGSGEPPRYQSTDTPPEARQVADQIVYDVVIKNHDPEDVWTTQCLAGLKRAELVDFIFAGLYEEQFMAFDIFSDEAIPPRKIRKMEEEGEFDRDQVSKIQFVEAWYVDPGRYTLTKKVTEVRLGTEHFDGFGLLLGHNPLFKVRLVPE